MMEKCKSANQQKVKLENARKTTAVTGFPHFFLLPPKI